MRNVGGRRESGREKRGSGIFELGVNQLLHHVLLWSNTGHTQLIDFSVVNSPLALCFFFFWILFISFFVFW